MKRSMIYVATTFILTWGTIIGAGLALGTFETGASSSMTMIAFVAASMFFPLVGALLTNRIIAPEQRINPSLQPHIKGNVRLYLVAWFAPMGMALAGFIMFFLAFPQLFDPTFSYIRTVAASAGADIDPDALPAMLTATVTMAIFFAPFINMIPALGEEAGWRGMLYPSLRETLPHGPPSLSAASYGGFGMRPSLPWATTSAWPIRASPLRELPP